MGQSDDFFCFSGLEEAKPTSTFQVRNYPGQRLLLAATDQNAGGERNTSCAHKAAWGPLIRSLLHGGLPYVPHGGLGKPGPVCWSFRCSRSQQLRRSPRAAGHRGKTRTSMVDAIFLAARRPRPPGCCVPRRLEHAYRRRVRQTWLLELHRPARPWSSSDSPPIRERERKERGGEMKRNWFQCACVGMCFGTPGKDGGARLQLLADYVQVWKGLPKSSAEPGL